MRVIPIIIKSSQYYFLLSYLLLFFHSNLSSQTVPQHYSHLPSNSGVNNLFFNDAACEKFQFIYTQSEINNMISPVSGPIIIDTIWFRFGGGTSSPSTTLSNFQIRMGHTTLVNPGVQFNTNFNVGTAQTVLSSVSYNLTPLIGAWNTTSNNWTFIVLQTPFSYNFTNNLCIELSFASSSAAIAGNYADNGGVPISQYAGNSTATSASGTSSRPVFGISSGTVNCPLVTVTSSQINVTCSGGSDGSATVVPSGGTSFTYSWSPSGGSDATASSLSAGNYTCTITNECGNSTTQTFTITETVSYQLNATVIQPTCGNNNACISFAPSPVGTYFYSWPFPTNFTVSSVCNLSPGSYDITINSVDGCPRDTTIIIEESTSFSVIETITPATCDASDGAISVSTVNGTGPYSYSWSTGGSIGNTLSNLVSGNYSVTIADQNGCAVTENYTVPQNNSFNFDVFPASSTINPGGSIQLNASGATTYNWSPSTSLNCNDCSNPIASPTENTVYMVIGQNTGGCVDTAYASISIHEEEFLYIPNTFTPDGDELNNTFFPVFSDAFDDQNYLLTIYNRWGEVIFQTRNKNIGWNGSYNGILQPNGVYTYTVELKRKSNDSVEIYSGHITLLK